MSVTNSLCRLLLVFSLGALALAQEPRSAGLEDIVQAYTEAEKEIDTEIAPGLGTARRVLADALAVAVEKLEKDEKSEEAARLRAEMNRIEKDGSNAVLSDWVPSAAKNAWRSYEQERDRLVKSVAAKHTAIRARYFKELGELEKQSGGDEAALRQLRQVKAAIVIRNALETGRVGYTDAEKTQNVTRSTAADGGYLIGLAAGIGTWSQSDVLGLLQPVYATATGNSTGASFGKASKRSESIAKDGYAIGAVKIRERGTPDHHVIACIQPVFMKIKADGLSLDPKDSYEGEWLGGEGGTKAKEIGGKGKPIVGMQCKTGDVVDSLTLIYLK